MVALFVLSTIVLFLLVDLVVIYARRRKMAQLEVPASAVAQGLQPHGVPAGLFIHPSHLWVTVDPKGSVRVGLDELAQRLMGPLEVVRFPSVGRRIARGETLFSVQVGDVEVPIASPISGTLQATQVPEGASTLNPESWLCAIEPERLGEEIRPMRIAEQAAAWMTSEFHRLREMLHTLQLRPAMTLPDGGELASGLLQILSPKDRDTVVQEFIRREA